VLTSTADRLVSSHCSTSIARVLGAKLAVHGEAGHDITLDAPAWVCEQVAS
jgi:pimeloyl-[acyl-carrier protein] methyl ester esterase